MTTLNVYVVWRSYAVFFVFNLLTPPDLLTVFGYVCFDALHIPWTRSPSVGAFDLQSFASNGRTELVRRCDWDIGNDLGNELREIPDSNQIHSLIPFFVTPVHPTPSKVSSRRATTWRPPRLWCSPRQLYQVTCIENGEG